MEDRICHQYIIGFCTRQIFFIQNLTQKCTKLHDNGKKAAYDSNSIYEKDKDVFIEYKRIIDELEQKIIIKNKFLSANTDYIIGKISSHSNNQLNNNFGENKDLEKIIQTQNRIQSQLESNNIFKNAENERNNQKPKYLDTQIQRKNNLGNSNTENAIKQTKSSIQICQDKEQQKTFKLKELIDAIDNINSNFTNNLEKNKHNYKLHRIYSKTLLLIENAEELDIYTVCAHCSHIFEKNSTCDHPFHDKYIELKKITKSLASKLKIPY